MSTRAPRQGIYVPLNQEEWDSLCDIARREHRAPRDQAAWLMAKAMREVMVTLPQEANDGTA